MSPDDGAPNRQEISRSGGQVVVTFKYGPSYAPRTYTSVYVSVQESVEAKATLAPGLLWRLVRSNRCPAASCICSGKRFHYSTPVCIARGIWRAKSLGRRKAKSAQRAKLAKATKGRNVARIRPRGKAKRSFSSRKGNGVVPLRRIISL